MESDIENTQKKMKKADYTYAAFKKADACSKNYFSLTARTYIVLEHVLDGIKRYDPETKDFTPESKELARKWWHVRTVYDDLRIDRLTHKAIAPRKKSDTEKLSKKVGEIEREMNFVKGSLKILYGIEPDD